MNKQDWTYKKLGEVATIVGGSTPKSNIEEYWGGTNYWVTPADLDGNKYQGATPRTITDLAVQKTNLQLLPIGTVLLSSRAPIGKVAITTVPMYCNQGFKNVVCSDLLINEFVYWYLFGKVDYLNSLGRGATFKEISKRATEQIPIPVPPIAEQERIVAELDLLSGIIEKKKEQLKAYDQLAQSIFYSMFGDPIDNPKGWETKTIGNTCTITCGQDYKTVEDENGKYPIYGTGGIMGWANQFRCPKDSVIIGRKGNINNPILVNADFWNVDTAFGVTPNNEVLSAIYFFFFCKEYDFTQHDVSVTIPSLRRTDILKIKLPVPPLSLQQEFAEKIEAIERQKALVQQSIDETQTMFDCTMDKYFG